MPKISHSALRRNFRDLLATPLCVETASVFDPMSARIAADLGFEVGILGGSVASLQVLAAPASAVWPSCPSSPMPTMATATP